MSKSRCRLSMLLMLVALLLPLFAWAAWSPSLADGPVAAEPAFVLVRDGQPAATIVIPAEAQASVRYAATLLQRCVRDMSGAELPIVGDDQAVGGPVVLIGATLQTLAMELPIPSGFTRALAEEGYVIRSTPAALVLAGNDRGPAKVAKVLDMEAVYKGSLFATLEVLQRLGCRWYFPGSFGEVLPASATVSLPALDLLVKPSLAVRGFWYGSAPVKRKDAAFKQAMEEWMVRSRFLPYSSVLASAGDGSIMAPFRAWRNEEHDGKKVRINTVFEEHPAWFALRADGTRNEHYLCLSNPEVMSRTLDHIRDWFAKNPTEHCYGIAPPDGAPTCECADCRAQNAWFMQKDPSNPKIQDISGGFYAFMNEVAKTIAVEYPDKWVTTTAYSGRIRPPENLELSPNISLHTALLAHSRHHRYDFGSWQTRERVRLYERWAALNDYVVERPYYPVMQFHCNVPQYMYRAIPYNVRLIARLGMRGSEWEGRAAFMCSGLNTYIRSQLLWNTETDVDALLADYYQRFYGAAGPAIQAFDEALEEALIMAPLDHHEEERLPEIYPHELVVRITDALGDLAKVAANEPPATQARVRYATLIADHLRAYSDMRHAEQQLDFATAAAKAQAMIAMEAEIERIDTTLLDSNGEYTDSKVFYGELGANASPHGKLKQYLAKQRLIDGTAGELVAALPEVWEFTTDPRDEGLTWQWYLPEHAPATWRPIATTLAWETQGNQDEQCYGYDGFGWYRTTVDIPARFAGRRVVLFLGGFNNQAWVWVNGKLAGGTPYHEYWQRWAYHAEVDITDEVVPGKTNALVIRVWNDQDAGGIFRRCFLYAPKK